MNLNGKLKKKWGASRGPSKNLGGHGPPKPPLRIATVSTPFSFLCLILLTDLHKNAGFHSNMLNYLNTNIHFWQTNFINTVEILNVGLHTHSFIHSFIVVSAFPWESRGGSSLRKTRNNSQPTATSARTEMQSRHLVLGRHLGLFPVGVCRL